MPTQKNPRARNDILERYYEEIARFPLLSREEELSLGKELTGESCIERIITKATQCFAEDYLQQTAAIVGKQSLLKQAYLRYTSMLDPAEQVQILRTIYADTPPLYRDFIATVADYLLQCGVKWDRVPESPVWKDAWTNHQAYKKKDPRTSKKCILDFSPEILQYAREHSQVQQALYKGYISVNHISSNAHHVFIERNLRRVVSIAKLYQNKGLSLEDLIQQGNIGLYKGARHFDYMLGTKFSTYVQQWIEQACTRGIDNEGRTIRVPVAIMDDINRIYRIMGNFSKKNKREPTTEDFLLMIEQTLNIKGKNAQELLEVTQRLDTVSLEHLPLQEASSDISFFTENMENLFDARELHEEIDGLLAELSPRQEEVIRMRYGIGTLEELNLREIGERIGTSRETVRKIENNALHALRERKEKLRVFLF